MFILDTIAGLIVGLLAGVLARPRRSPEPDGVPITWCGNCGQPTSALCFEHKQQAAKVRRDG
ncbi:hypothetical protein [Catellatospora citrea]|uniref:Uncharacterized protein n=1 Tax=Catellatospora citrea TaxID=53366 RepID=A0A8J3KBN9_9ACTN|nr:hypothetical protein [Catellatospora citrea]RKE11917.1 hypothetical protein C8E86_6849 [Catellatospora citrea]GIG00252.1 hypothetical protein Cci01nite_53450 [Catellatospora citrea]